MVVTYKQLPKIRFPVYKLPSNNWDYVSGLLYVDGKLFDDTNMPGDTLGLRRLQTPKRELERLNRKIDSLTGILKQTSNCFIDTNGTPFIYVKTITCELKYYKIKRVDRKGVACVLWVEGVKSPFTIPRPPSEGMHYAGILHLKGLPWVLYEYSEERKKDTRRKV